MRGIDLRDLLRRGGGRSRLTWRRLDVLLDALPGESLYKSALRDSIADEDLLRLAAEPRKGHGKWSHTDLLLADIIDRLGHLGYALHAYEKPPEPYHRPGIVRRGRRSNPAVTAAIRAIAREHAELHGYSLDDPSP